MPKIELPEGNSAEMKDVDDLRRADVRAAMKMADQDGVNLISGQFGFDGIAAIQDAILVRFIRKWTISNGDGQPLEITLEAVKDLRYDYYRPLETYIRPVVQTVMAGDEEPSPT